METCELQRRRNKSLQSSADKKTARIVRECKRHRGLPNSCMYKISDAICHTPFRKLVFGSTCSLDRPSSASAVSEIWTQRSRRWCRWCFKVTMTPGSLTWHQLARFNRPKRTEQRNNYKLGTPRNEIAVFLDLNGFSPFTVGFFPVYPFLLAGTLRW